MHTTLRLAQINILNSEEGYLDRYGRLQEHLALVQPDVVTVQEIIDVEALTVALEPLGFTHSFFGDVVVEGNHARSHCTGILSRHPLVDEKSFKAEHEQAIPIAHASLDAHGRQVSIFSAHNAWGGRGELNRLKTAALIDAEASRIKAANPEAVVLLGGDMNSDPDSRSMRFLRGLDLGPDNETSTYWIDAYLVAGDADQAATSDHSQGTLGPATAAPFGIYRPELLPARRIDFLMSHGWSYGKAGSPVTYGRFGDPLRPGELELSDHYGIWADFLVE